MSIISRTGDLFYAYRFLRLLVTPWEKTEAFKLGIIDTNGTVIKKGSERQSSEEKAAYTVFHRLVFNIKRLLQKLPFGRSKLASWATALFLIKEETGMSEKQLMKILDKLDIDFDDTLFESTWYMNEGGQLQPGIYTLTNHVISPSTGEIIGSKNTKVEVSEATSPIGYMIGTPIYKVQHIKSGQEVYVNPGEIIR